MKKILFLLLVFSVQISLAQTGTILGTVSLDEEGTIVPGPFANVALFGTTTGATTDFDGNFNFIASPGTYKLVISSIGYLTDTTDITLKAGEVLTIDRTLKSSALNLATFTVEATQDRTNENYQLMEQKNATTIQQSIGAAELSAKGVSDVAEGLTKVSGISQSSQSSGSVFVRGMGDRYNNAMLNGLPVPSPNPDKKVIPLDVFPTSIVSSLGISKTFTPNLYGDFAGGTIDIKTKNYSDKPLLQIGIGTSMNTITTFKPFYTTNGDRLDKLGYENGERSLPEEIRNAEIYRTDTKNPTKPFTNGLTPKRITAMPTYSLSLLGGSSKKLKNNMLIGFLVAASHGNKYQTRVGNDRNVDTYGADINNYDFEKYTYSTGTSALENVYFEINENHKISFNSVYVHDSNNELSLYDSQMEDRDRQGYLYSMRNTLTQNTLLVNQFGSNHKMLNNKLNFDWRVSTSSAKNEVPDRYQMLTKTTSDSKDAYLPEGLNAADNNRFFSELNEGENAGTFNLSYNFKKDTADVSKVYGAIKAGAQFRSKTRTFYWRQINMNISQVIQHQESVEDYVDPLNPEEYINDSNLNAGLFEYKEQIDPSREHLIEQNIFSGYVMLDYDLVPKKFNVTAGVRAEQSNQLIRYKKLGDLFSGAPRIATYDTLVVLPSLSLKYALTEKSNVRMAASQTVSRPGMKELSPFQFQDQSNVLFEGNPNLYNSINYNGDLKYEIFPNSGEVIAVSVFGKYIKNPIERAQIPSSGILYSYFNMGTATVAGAEFEFSKKLSNLITNESSFLNNVSIGFNASYLYTRITLGDEGIIETSKGTLLATNNTRPMTGASPYLINADLGYEFTIKDKIKSKWALTYNVFGKRVFAAGVQGRGDIYELPLNTIDLVVKNKISDHLNVNFSIKNLLNPTTRTVQEVNGEQYMLMSFKRGQSVTFGITYDLF